MSGQVTLFDRPMRIPERVAPSPESSNSAFRCNPTVEEAQKARLGGQALRIYRALLHGPLWTHELLAFGAQYNARVKELRDWLRGFGWTVDKTSSHPNGRNRYELKPFAGSKYQATLIKRGIRA